MTEDTTKEASISVGKNITNSVVSTTIEKNQDDKITTSASGEMKTDNVAKPNDKIRKRALAENEISTENDCSPIAKDSSVELDRDSTEPSAKKVRTESSSAPVFGSSMGFKAFQTGSQSKNLSAATDSNVTSVFGSSKVSQNSTFGKGIAKTPSGFGSGVTSTSIFGSSVAKTSFGSTLTNDKTSPTELSPHITTKTNKNTLTSSSGKQISLPEAGENIMNGEENEETILTLRAKLFKLTKEAKINASPLAKDPLGKNSRKVGIQMATKVGESDSNENNVIQSNPTASIEKKAFDNNAGGKSSIKMDWKEVGIGPLRILTDDCHVRIVQRRENTPGGQGTKLILNIRLGEKYGSLVEKKGDKFIRLAAFEPAVEMGDEEKNESETDEASNQTNTIDIKFVPVQYLFKVKTVAEADSMLKTLQQYCKKVGDGQM